MTPAALVPRPPELLPGAPDAVVDLQSEAGCALVGATWRYSDAQVVETAFVALAGPGAEDPLGPGEVPNRTYDVVPPAQAADFDDSGWRVLAPGETRDRLANGKVCFNWYRTVVTVPDAVGGFDPTGATIVFETVVDDYAEIWVDGEMGVTLGTVGGHVAAGFNAPNRVVLTRDARPGQRFVIAVFGINGPISASPANYIWMRTASLDFFAPGRAYAPQRVGEDGLEVVATGLAGAAGPVWDGAALLVGSPGSGAIYRLEPDIGRLSVFRAKSWARALAFDDDGRLLIGRDDHTLRVNPHGDTTVLTGALPASEAGEYSITPTSLYRTRRNP